jgi:hypothetical protein
VDARSEKTSIKISSTKIDGGAAETIGGVRNFVHGLL